MGSAADFVCNVLITLNLLDQVYLLNSSMKLEAIKSLKYLYVPIFGEHFVLTYAKLCFLLFFGGKFLRHTIKDFSVRGFESSVLTDLIVPTCAEIFNFDLFLQR